MPEPPRILPMPGVNLAKFDAISQAIQAEKHRPKDTVEPPHDPRISLILSDIPEFPKRSQVLLELLRDSLTALVYQREGVLVRITGISTDKAKISLLTLDGLRHEIGKAVKCLKRKQVRQHNRYEECYEEIEPPLSDIRNAFASGEFPFDPLNGILRHPTITQDGVLLNGPYEYNRITGLYIVADAETALAARHIPQHPRDEDIHHARDTISTLLTDFPFIDHADKAHAFALFLTILCRPLIPGQVPAFLVQAPQAGTGKTLLVNALVTAVTGEQPHASLFSAGDEAEVRKQIVSVLMEGGEYIFFDNVQGRLQSAALCAVITSAYFKDRLLGKNETITLPVTCPLIMTANNPNVDIELARRIIPIRLDGNAERPWERDGFTHPNLLDYVKQNRSSLIAAGLTLARAWISRGRQSGTRLGSFEGWSSTIGGILMTAGITGFLGNTEQFYQSSDLDTAKWTAFIKAWREQYEDKPVLAKELAGLAAAAEIIAHESKIKSLGTALAGKEGHIFGGLKVVRGIRSNKGNPWMVKPLNDR